MTALFLICSAWVIISLEWDYAPTKLLGRVHFFKASLLVESAPGSNLCHTARILVFFVLCTSRFHLLCLWQSFPQRSYRELTELVRILLKLSHLAQLSVVLFAEDITLSIYWKTNQKIFGLRNRQEKWLTVRIVHASADIVADCITCVWKLIDSLIDFNTTIIGNSLDEDVVYEELPQPHVIETGDSVKVKQVLDDATNEILIGRGGFQPNYSWENIKLFLMFLSCVFAMIAQFFPIPFPDSRPLLGLCCAMYFILSTVLQLMITYIDKDVIMIGNPDTVSMYTFYFWIEPVQINAIFQWVTLYDYRQKSVISSDRLRRTFDWSRYHTLIF